MPQLAPHIFEVLYARGVEHAFGIPGGPVCPARQPEPA